MRARSFPRRRAAAACALVIAASAAAPSGASAIIGGRVAEAGSYPWLAHVSDFYGEFVGECSGTVIAPKLVLTAAHCVVDLQTARIRDSAGFQVVTGNVNWQLAPRQLLGVHAVAVEPGFNRVTHDDDAALLILSTPTDAPAITLARRPDDSALLRAGTPASLVGWGETSYGQRAPTPALHEAETSLQAGSWCEQNAPPFFVSSQLCVIDPPQEATGPCDGDSGGPLIADSAPAEAEPTYVELGILSGGYGRCATRRPSVYTRVDAVYPWIHSWIERLSQP